MKSASQCNKNKACSYTSKMEAAFTLETELPGLTEGEREHLHFSDCHLKLRWGADGQNVKPERVPAFPSWCSSLCALVFHCFNSYHLCSCFTDVQRAPSYITIPILLVHILLLETFSPLTSQFCILPVLPLLLFLFALSS